MRHLCQCITILKRYCANAYSADWLFMSTISSLKSTFFVTLLIAVCLSLVFYAVVDNIQLDF